MTLRIVAFLALFLGALPLAHADDPPAGRVLIVRTGHEPACLDLAGLARAVGRHASRATLVVDADAEPGAGDTTIRLAALGGSARVELRFSGHVVQQQLTVEPCDTLPEQVGAFVASSLTTLPEPEPQEAAPASPPPVIPTPADLAQRRRAERAAILADVLKDIRPTSSKHIAIVAGTATGAWLFNGVAGAVSNEFTDTSRVELVAAGSIGLAGAVTALTWSNSDAAEPILFTTSGVALGLTMMAFAEPSPNLEDSKFGPGRFIFGASYVGLSLGYGLGKLIQPSPATWRVRQHYKTVQSAEARDTITEEQLAAVERDLRANSGPYPMILRAAPFAVGALVSVALIQKYEKDDDQLTDLLIWGVGFNAAGTLLSFVTPTPWETYQKRLKAAQIDLQIVPTSDGAMVGLSGTF